jgi:hypothetical protein
MRGAAPRTRSASPGPESAAGGDTAQPVGLSALTASTGEFRPETLVAIEALKRAFAVAQRDVAPEDITAKGARDLVTAADDRPRGRKVAGRPAPAGRAIHRRGHPGRSMGSPVARDHAGLAVRGRRPRRGVRRLLGFGSPRRGRQPARHRSGRHCLGRRGATWTIHSDSLVGSANVNLHEELLALARASGAPTNSPE